MFGVRLLGSGKSGVATDPTALADDELLEPPERAVDAMFDLAALACCCKSIKTWNVARSGLAALGLGAIGGTCVQMDSVPFGKIGGPADFKAGGGWDAAF